MSQIIHPYTLPRKFSKFFKNIYHNLQKNVKNVNFKVTQAILSGYK